MLNSELGSRLFRSVVEVNPQPTVEALDYAIGDWTSDELRTNFKTGRRNIVWALEKLVFRKETFNLAAKMMCKLAAGENETYGNNATGQFMQLFHIYLAGTESDFEERLEVIKWGLEQEDEQIKAVSITACGHALKSHGFHRTIGAEDQGLVTRLKEYKPETWDQIYDYWKEVVFLLVDTAEKNVHLIGIIKVQISAAIRSMFGSGQSKVIVDAIKRIVAIDPSLWSEAIDDLKRACQFEDLDKEEKELADELIRFLTPEEIGDRLQFLVIKPEWEYSRDVNVDTTQKKAEDFGLEVAERKLDIIPYLQDLLTGEQRQTYFFGAKLASHENIHNIIDETIKCLSNVPENQQNPALLAGILASVSLSEQRRVISKLLENDHVNRHVFYLIRLIKPNISEIEQLFDLVDNGKTAIRNFEGFRYGRALDHLTDAEVLGLFEKITSYGVDGASTAFAIASQHCFQDEARWNIYKDFIRAIIMKYSIFTDFINARSQDEYLWSTQVIKLLEQRDDTELAQTISDQIIIGAEQQDFNIHDSYLIDVVNVLCTNYFKIFWEILKDVLLENSIRYFKLKSLLGSHNGSGESSGVLFTGDHDVIIDWCKHSSPKAAYRIAYMMPIYGKDGWSDFAMRMIDEFGNDRKVLDEIGANMGSFSMVGSSENYYNRIIEMAKKLYNHKYPNVRKWAKSCVQYHDKLIRREKLDDEQRS